MKCGGTNLNPSAMTEHETTPHTRHRGRFAPSPTGPLHFGSLLAAFGSWLMARAGGGQWLVWDEDPTPPREVPGAAEGKLRALSALAREPAGPVLWQSARNAASQAALARLLASGAAFACPCSRSDLAASGGVPRACV